MMSRRRVGALVAWVVSLALAFYAGGIVGFNKGMETQLSLAGGDALVSVALLQRLHAGDTAKATSLLEATLDSQIANAVFGSGSYCSLYNVPMRFTFPQTPAAEATALKGVLQYREEHPSPSVDLAPKLMEQLARYRDAPSLDLSAGRVLSCGG
jgi:hypothetical protein